MWYLFDFFFKSNAVSFRCLVNNFDVLSTNEQLVDECLGEAFLGRPQTHRHFFLLSVLPH